MSRKCYLWFLLLLLPISIFIVFACLFATCKCNAKWLELSLSTAGTIATIILGVMVYIQAEQHKHTADENREHDSRMADANREHDRRVAAENREQDLLLKANPHASFDRIDCLNYTSSHMLISKEGVYNRLCNIDFDGYHNFKEHVYMDMKFCVPSKNVVESVYIKEVELRADKGIYAGGNFEEIADIYLTNYAPKNSSPNIKIRGNGSVDALLSLLFEFGGAGYEQQDILDLLNDEELRWIMNISYSLSNSFGVTIDYNTILTFELQGGIENEYGDLVFQVIKSKSVTTQTSNIELKRDNNCKSEP